MHKDVHASALRAAAKVAFSMAFLGGCSSPARSPDGAPGEGYDSVTSDVTDKAPAPPTASASAAPAPVPPCHDAGAPKRSCKEVVASAFPDAGWVSPGEGKPVGADVKACCEELLSSGDLLDFPERWACCDAVGAFQGGGDPKIAMACTPWGPPVPPAMRRRAPKPAPQPRPAFDAWVA